MDLIESRLINDYSRPMLGLVKDFGHEFWNYLLVYCGVFPDDIANDPDFANFCNFWQIWLIRHEDQTVGLCGLYSLENASKDLWLGWFGILPEFRSLGIGGEVVEKMSQIAKDMGYTGLKSYVDYKNDKAMKFYERHGFKRLCSVMGYVTQESLPKPIVATMFENVADHVIRRSFE